MKTPLLCLALVPLLAACGQRETPAPKTPASASVAPAAAPAPAPKTPAAAPAAAAPALAPGETKTVTLAIEGMG